MNPYPEDDLQAALNHQQELEHQQQAEAPNMTAHELLANLTPEFQQVVLRAAYVNRVIVDQGLNVSQALDQLHRELQR